MEQEEVEIKESEEQKKYDFEEIIKKYNIDLRKLEEEQKKLAKNISLKDSIDFSLADRVAGIESVFFQNKIISAVVVMQNGEIIEQEYFSDKIKFPYLPGFRAYRELPCMLQAFNKLDEKPDIIFIHGNGILHPRGLGLVSHFSLVSSVATIGIADSLLCGIVKGEDVFLDNKAVGKILKLKEGANPLYVSPGNLISLKTSIELVKTFTKPGHKIPEPLRLARKYAKEVRKEIFQLNP